jgi:RNA polymerase sigma factor (sigma-70 family)
MEANSDILIDLKGENNHAFEELYKNYFSTVSRFVNKNNGTDDDAQDIFQDTMLVLIEKLRQDNFELTASLKTYIMAIAKHLWLNRLKITSRQTEFTNHNDNQFYEEINLSIENEKTYWDKLQNYMTFISAHCNRLIHDMFFMNKGIEQIQEDYGYSTVHNAQNQKHKCIEQIKKVKDKDKTK